MDPNVALLARHPHNLLQRVEGAQHGAARRGVDQEWAAAWGQRSEQRDNECKAGDAIAPAARSSFTMRRSSGTIILARGHARGDASA